MKWLLREDGTLIAPRLAMGPNGELGDGVEIISQDDSRYQQLKADAVPAVVYRRDDHRAARRRRAGEVLDVFEEGQDAVAAHAPEGPVYRMSRSLVGALHLTAAAPLNEDRWDFVALMVSEQSDFDWFIDELAAALEDGTLTLQAWSEVTGVGPDPGPTDLLDVLRGAKAARDTATSPE